MRKSRVVEPAARHCQRYQRPRASPFARALLAVLPGGKAPEGLGQAEGDGLPMIERGGEKIAEQPQPMLESGIRCLPIIGFMSRKTHAPKYESTISQKGS